MSQKLTSTILITIMALALFSSMAFARGANEKLAKMAATTAHNYKFQPDPLTVSRTAGKMDVTKPAMQSSYRPGSRYYYRETFSSKSRAENPSLAMSGSLGTKWPTTLYNRNRGQGRELSRVFK